ncbi:MAG TPA: FAD-dependent oxidoreductase, partial [Vineibacter sp.]|nr:FAD-dependent oxidoreductase [Vineibacter sp.]
MHVLIVGAGIAGLGAAWALMRDGHRVTVLEQGAIPNPRGTSVDMHRLIRRAYGAETGYMRMITHAYAAWDRMWADLGVKLLIDTGALSMSALTDDWVATSLQALKADGLPVEELDTARLAARFPLVSLSNGNADLTKIGLDRFFRFSITSREFGKAKPAAEIFHA